MKKTAFLFSLIFFLGISLAEAQTRLGIRLAPTISANRVEGSSDSLDYVGSGVGLRYVIGPYLDFYLAENYYVNTGVFFAPKRAALRTITKNTREEYVEQVNLQYLQIPLSMKLFTNELALDTRVYFQFGFQTEVLIASKFQTEDPQFIEKFHPVDLSLLVAAGIEYRAGYSTVLFGGFSYNRGFINTVRRLDSFAEDAFKLRQDLFGLEMGIKF